MCDQLGKPGREQTNRSRQLRNLSDALVRYSHGLREDDQSLVRYAKSVQSERFALSNRGTLVVSDRLAERVRRRLEAGADFGEFSGRQVDSLLLCL